MSIEAEKNSNYRYSSLAIPDVLDAIGELEDIPDVICAGGGGLVIMMSIYMAPKRMSDIVVYPITMSS